MCPPRDRTFANLHKADLKVTYRNELKIEVFAGSALKSKQSLFAFLLPPTRVLAGKQFTALLSLGPTEVPHMLSFFYDACWRVFIASCSLRAAGKLFVSLM